MHVTESNWVAILLHYLLAWVWLFLAIVINIVCCHIKHTLWHLLFKNMNHELEAFFHVVTRVGGLKLGGDAEGGLKRKTE